MTLNANQARVLAGGVGGIDRDLDDLALRLARDDIEDMSEPERRVLIDHLRVARRRLRDGLARLDLRLPKPPARMRGPTSTALAFAGIHLADLRPKALRGYGALDAATAARIERFIADAARAIATAQGVLANPAVDLEERIHRVATGEGGARDVARLAAVIERHGLVELRGSLESLVEQLESRTFEIAFFGRVSSGKSELLNAVLGMSVLPVGALPVTAVPTRIVAGDRGAVTVLLAGETAPVEHPLTELADFVTEEKNPDNVRRVSRVTVTVPAERLRSDVALVDTPGVGSLAAAGARATYAYLPRCDLGILAVAAGGTLEHEDIDLVRRLHDSGIDAQLVVTKADLLTPEDRVRFSEYVRTRMTEACGIVLPVTLVSTVGSDAALATTWFSRDVAPLFDVAKAARERSSARKLAALRSAVLAALRPRSGGVPEVAAGAEIDEIAGAIETVLEKAEDRCHDLAGAAVDLTAAVIRSAAKRVVTEPGTSAANAVREALLEATDEIVRRVRSELLAARDQIRELLRGIPGDEIEIDFLSLPVAGPLTLPAIRVRGWSRWIPGRRGRLERALIDVAAEPVSGVFYRFTGALRQWSRAARRRLSQQAAARMEHIRIEVV